MNANSPVEGTAMPSKRLKYTQETVDAVARRFDAAPPAPKPPNRFGSPALVRALAPKIRQMVDKGYTWDAMAEMMAVDGVTIRPSVLRKYAAQQLDRPKAKKKTKSGARPVPSRSPSTPSATPASGAQAAQPANAVSPADDAWDLDSTDNAHGMPEVHPPKGRPQSPSPLSSVSTPLTTGRSPSSWPAVRPDTKDL